MTIVIPRRWRYDSRIRPITYNFDPDRWLENHQALLDKKLHDGEIDRQEHRDALQDLEERYHRMCRRLDGSYRLPDKEQSV